MPGPSIEDLKREARRRHEILGEGVTQGIEPGDPFIQGHLSGYGQTETPGSFGHNRDVFDREHPGYDGPDEAPPTSQFAPGNRDDWARQDHEEGPDEAPPSFDMGNLPSGGNSEAGEPQIQNSQAQAQDMPGAGEPSLAQLAEMLSTYAENAQTSNGT